MYISLKQGVNDEIIKRPIKGRSKEQESIRLFFKTYDKKTHRHHSSSDRNCDLVFHGIYRLDPGSYP